MQKAVYKTFLGSPLKLWASVGHWWIWHFDLNKYTEKQKPRVSGDAAAAAAAVESMHAYHCCWPPLLYHLVCYLPPLVLVREPTPVCSTAVCVVLLRCRCW
jgi:hypothetical protein